VAVLHGGGEGADGVLEVHEGLAAGGVGRLEPAGLQPLVLDDGPAGPSVLDEHGAGEDHLVHLEARQVPHEPFGTRNVDGLVPGIGERDYEVQKTLGNKRR